MPTSNARTRARSARSAPRRAAAAPAAPSGFQLVRLIPSGRSLLIGFALIGVAAALYVAARQTSVVAVRVIRVEGAPAAVTARIRAALRPLEGVSLVRIGTAAVAERLTGIPEVETVSVDRAFPHGLHVRITTARRVAVLRQGKAAFLVSERGRILARTARTASPGLPRVWVPTAVDLAVGASVGDARLATAVRAATAVFRDGVGGLRVRAVDAGEDILTFTLRNGLQVRLGTLQQLPLKLAIARKILAAGGVAHYVDVSVPERPVAGTNSQVEG